MPRGRGVPKSPRRSPVKRCRREPIGRRESHSLPDRVARSVPRAHSSRGTAREATRACLATAEPPQPSCAAHADLYQLVPERVIANTPAPPGRPRPRRTAAPRRRCARGSATRCSARSLRLPRHTAPRGGTRGTPSPRSVRGRRRRRTDLHPAARRRGAPLPGCGANRPRRVRRARSRGLGKALTFEPLDQEREGPIENLGRVARRHRVAQQRLGAPEPVVRLAGDGELNPVTRRRDRPRCARAGLLAGLALHCGDGLRFNTDRMLCPHGGSGPPTRPPARRGTQGAVARPRARPAGAGARTRAPRSGASTCVSRMPAPRRGCPSSDGAPAAGPRSR